MNVTHTVAASLIAALVTCACSDLHGQTIEWRRQLGTSGGDIGRAISVDGIGNVYISGDTDGNLGAPNLGSSDVFVSKYDTAGSLLWTRQLGSSSYDVSTGVSADSLGNVYIVGNTDGNLGGVNQPGTDLFVSKYDSTGNFQWTRQIATATPNGIPAVAADGLGNVYVASNTNTSLGQPIIGFDDAFIRKYDSAGNILWTRQVGSSGSDIALGVTADRLGNVFISGDTNGSIVGTGHGWDTFVSKFDSAGNPQWTRQFGTIAEDSGSGIAADGLGNVVTGGRTNGNLAGTNAGDYDAFIAKFDTAGTVKWTRQFGTSEYDESPAVWADQFGNIYAGGTTNGYLGAGNNMGGDVFVRKYDSFGNPDWTNQILSPNFDAGLGLSGDGLGSIFLGGYTTGNIGGTSAGGIDAFTIKLAAPVPEPPTAVLIAILGFCVSMRRSQLGGQLKHHD